MRGARIYYPRVPRLMREDHRRISPRCVTNRNSSCTISLDHTRHITLPAARLGGPPGTKLSQQAALAGPPGTKLSQQARLGGPPGTKLSQRAPKRRFRPTFRMQGELCTASATNTTSRENFIPHAEPLPVQNSPSHPARRPTRYKTLPARPARRPTRYKTLPASPKTPISAHFSHAGRTLYRFRHQQPEQGEKVTHQHPTAPQQRAPPQISHAIRLNELSTKPRNVAIPTK